MWKICIKAMIVNKADTVFAEHFADNKSRNIQSNSNGNGNINKKRKTNHNKSSVTIAGGGDSVVAGWPSF